MSSMRFPDDLLCTCTINAVAKSGVARLTTGIITNSAMSMPARKTCPRCARRSALASAGGRKRIAAREIGIGEEEDEKAEAGEQHEGQGTKIDDEAEQRRQQAFPKRQPQG